MFTRLAITSSVLLSSVASAQTPIAGGEEEVRAPTAADLTTYTRRYRGFGPLVASIETNLGSLHCELAEAKAPMTVANFVGLASGQKPYLRNGHVVRGVPFYDGLIFHRVIPEFMIQGGDPDGRGSGGPGYKFGQEISPELSHVPGALSMANAGPGTNGSQFFIMEVAASRLDGGHTVFGQCRELGLIERIARVPRKLRDAPEEDVVIRRLTIRRQCQVASIWDCISAKAISVTERLRQFRQFVD